MDKKVAIIAIFVVVIVVGAGAGIALTSNNSEGTKYNLNDIKGAEQNTAITGLEGCYDKYTATGCHLLIYGNVNNDMTVDTADLIALRAIVKASSWDKEANPLADVNCDKVVDSKDITALEKILAKENTLLYYVNYNGYPEYIHYPVTGNIGINYDYGYMGAAILGIYDRITAGIDRWVGDKVTDTMYPGVHDLYNMGTEQTVEADLAAYQKAGVTVIMGSCQTALNNSLHESDYAIDYLNIRLDQVKYISNVDPIDRLVTTGFVFDKLDKAVEFYNWYTSLYNTIHTKFAAAGIDEKSFIIPYNTSEAVETSVDDAIASGRAMGDYTNVVSNLPLKAALEPSTTATGPCYKTTIENLYSINPDVLIISMWGSLTDQTSFEDGYATFKEKSDYFTKFKAYQDGQVYGVCYETFGTFAGVAVCYLLCSYIYPDIFDEDDGWSYVNEYFDKYTMLDDDTNLKDCGGLIVYKLGKTTP